MYEPFFEFRKRPFPAVSRVDQYFPGAAIEAARTTLVRCIRRAEGAGMVIGPSGTGKTMLCHVLADELGDQLRVVLLASGRLGSRRAMLQAVLYELGQPYRGLDEGEARLALADYITLSDECPNGILLLVDEAHTLPLRLLDEVRMTTNLAHEGKPWVRVVLAGGCALEERFASPKLDSFSQRIAARCYLESFNAAEAQQYIWAQISMAGGCGESLFPEAACQAAYRATDGVPRLINQVCDHALLLACAAGHRQITARHVEEAWADLQQLPTPWNGESAQTGDSGNVIEFGQLDDDETADDGADETPDTIPVLRISEEPDVEGQVDRIEQMLDRVDSEDDEFAPAGSIGPEIELRFDEPHNPFGEEFAEEELVDDGQDASGRATPGAPAHKPESRQPARILTGYPPEACTPTDCDAERESAVPDASIGRREIASPKADSDELESQLCCSVNALADDASPSAACTADNETAEVEPVEQQQDPKLSVVDDSDKHTAPIESDSAGKPVTSASRGADSPRPKYSRLFASLRQG